MTRDKLVGPKPWTDVASVCSIGAVVGRLSDRLACRRYRRGDHAGGLRDSGVAGLCALAGLPPQVGIYGYLLGGLGYALLGSSRQLAIGPTSAISLMIAGTVGAMAGGDAQRYAQIASLAAFTVALLCLSPGCCG